MELGLSKKKRIEICLITGALGSGKTTLLNNLLRSSQLCGSMVLINEFGDIGLDHEIVREVAEDVVLLSSGCLCCSLKGDLRDELTRIVEDISSGKLLVSGPIIIETTGLADPIPILQLINSDEVLQHHMAIKNVTTVVDAINIQNQVKEFTEVENQVVFADILAISKTDMASIADQSISLTIIDQLNPLAKRFEVREEHGMAKLIDALTSPYKRKIKLPNIKKEHNLINEEQISSFVFEIEKTVQTDNFLLWVQLLVQSQGERLLRMKGIVPFNDGKYYVHCTGPLFYPREPLRGIYNRDRGKLIFISRGLNEVSVAESFQHICGDQILEFESTQGFIKESISSGFTYIDIHPKITKKIKKIFSQKQIESICPYLLWGVHNPWSLASNHFDSWSILELCEDSKILEEIRKILGKNINLIGSEIITEQTPWLLHEEGIVVAQEACYMPVEPDRALACRIPLYPYQGHTANSKIVLHNLTQNWFCKKKEKKWAYLVLYFSDSQALFNRSNLHPANIKSAISRPLANTAAMPIWLVSGEGGAKNNYVTGYSRPQAEWLTTSA